MGRRKKIITDRDAFGGCFLLIGLFIVIAELFCGFITRRFEEPYNDKKKERTHRKLY